MERTKQIKKWKLPYTILALVGFLSFSVARKPVWLAFQLVLRELGWNAWLKTIGTSPRRFRAIYLFIFFNTVREILITLFLVMSPVADID